MQVLMVRCRVNLGSLRVSEIREIVGERREAFKGMERGTSFHNITHTPPSPLIFHDVI